MISSYASDYVTIPAIALGGVLAEILVRTINANRRRGQGWVSLETSEGHEDGNSENDWFGLHVHEEVLGQEEQS